jgi:uncharacterized membrane protein YccF (DUF307 family)
MFAFIGNFLWFVLGGVIGFLMWVALGCLFAITIIGFPFAIAAWRISVVAAFPFGKELVDARSFGEKRVFGTGFMNFLWILLAGLWLAIFHVLVAIVCFLSFILIFPVFFGLAHVKLAQASFAPLGKRILYTADVIAQKEQINREIEEMTIDPYRNPENPTTPAPSQLQYY